MSFYDIEEISESATIPGITVITAPDLLRPHLAAGEACIWIGAPESIEFEGYGQGTCSWKAALVHPDFRDHLSALPDTIDLAGTLYPALEISFETTFRK